MRNVVVARDAVAQAAGQLLVGEGGGAVDAVLAAVLAGAARSSSASLLGACGVLVAGTGVGAHFIDGRARAPGLGERRPRTPEAAPEAWTAAVPGLLAGILAAHAHFGMLPFGQVVRAAVSALREGEMDDGLRGRVGFLLQLPRTGIHTLAREGVLRAVLNVAGPIVGGVFTKDDLRPVPAPVVARPACVEAGHEVLLPPRRAGRYGANLPDALPPTRVESVVAADMHGVIAAASWVVCPSAAELPGVPGLSLASLLPQPRKGVPRWRPGEVLPVPLPVAVLLHERSAWAGMGVSGHGDVSAARDAAVTARLVAGGVSMALGDGSTVGVARDAVALWALREGTGDDVRAIVLNASDAGTMTDAPQPVA